MNQSLFVHHSVSLSYCLIICVCFFTYRFNGTINNMSNISLFHLFIATHYTNIDKTPGHIVKSNIVLLYLCVQYIVSYSVTPLPNLIILMLPIQRDIKVQDPERTSIILKQGLMYVCTRSVAHSLKCFFLISL